MNYESIGEGRGALSDARAPTNKSNMQKKEKKKEET